MVRQEPPTVEDPGASFRYYVILTVDPDTGQAGLGTGEMLYEDPGPAEDEVALRGDTTISGHRERYLVGEIVPARRPVGEEKP